MTAKHLALGGIPASLIAALVAILTKNYVHLTTDESIYYGGLALALGTALAHRIDHKGLKGLFSGLWSGSDSKDPPA